MFTKKIIIGVFLSLSIAANTAHVGFTKHTQSEPGSISVDLNSIDGMHGIQFDLKFNSFVSFIRICKCPYKCTLKERNIQVPKLILTLSGVIENIYFGVYFFLQ